MTKISITIDEKKHTVRLPYPSSREAIVDDIHECPACGVKFPLDGQGQPFPPFKVKGKNARHTHDTYVSDGVALCCERYVGKLEMKVDTIFGIEEDERVLNGPWKVY